MAGDGRDQRRWTALRRATAVACLAALLIVLGAGPTSAAEPDLFNTVFGSNADAVRSFWNNQRVLAIAILSAVGLIVLYVIFTILKSAADLDRDTAFARFVARRKIPYLLKRERYDEAATLYEKLGEPKEAADAYFRGELWNEAAQIYFRLGVKLKAARAYERAGNHATAAVTYEDTGDHEAAERCFRAANDLRSVAKMYEKIGQFKRAAELFREMGLKRDEAIAYEKGKLYDNALQLWQEQFRSYDSNVESLTPLAMRERNTVAAHIYKNQHALDPSRAIDFLCGIQDPEGVCETLQKLGEFSLAKDLKEELPRLAAAGRLGGTGAASAAGSQEPAPAEATPGASPSPTAPSPPPPPPQAGAPAPPAGSQSPLDEAQALMNQGEYESAGDMFAEAGDFLRAVDAFELALGAPADGFADQPLSAFQRELVDRIAWLYERNGTPELAAEFFQRIRLFDQAVELFLKIGEGGRAAQILEEKGNFESAAQIYQESGDRHRSILCLAQGRLAEGDAAGAGDLYLEVGELDAAADSFDSARAAGQISDEEWGRRMDLIENGGAGGGGAAAGAGAPPPGRPRVRTGRIAPPVPGTGPSGGMHRPSGVRNRPSRVIERGPVSGGGAGILSRLPGATNADGPPTGPGGRSTGRIAVPGGDSGIIKSKPTRRLGRPSRISEPPDLSAPRNQPSRVRTRPSRVSPSPAGGPPRGPSGVIRGAGGGRPSGVRPTGGRPSGVRPTGGRPAGGPPRGPSGVMRGGAVGGPPTGGPPRGPSGVMRGGPPRGPSGVMRGGAVGGPPTGGPPRGPSGVMRGGAVGGPPTGRVPNARQSGVLRPNLKKTAHLRRPSSGDRPAFNDPRAKAEAALRAGRFEEAANQFLALGDRAGARNAFKQAENWKAVADLWLDENNFYCAGILYFALGDVEDAVRTLTRVPDSDPDSLLARRVAAILYGLLGRSNDARTYFNVSFSDTVTENDVESLYYYAQTLEQAQNSWEDAAAIYGTILELDPNYRDSRSRLGALQQGRPMPPTSIYEDAERDSTSLFYTLQEDVMGR